MLKMFLTAFLIALVLTPIVRAVALRAKIIDIPNGRSLHDVPMPKSGGIAIYFAFALPVIWMLGRESSPIFGVLVGATLVLLLGFLDDAKGLSPLTKLIGQVAAAAVLVGNGIKIGLFPDVISIPLTLFWIVGVMNAINLLDGMDGMAAGISVIAALFFLFLALRNGDAQSALVSAALAGACLGFIKFNFHPASIFMGDTGSMFLGFVLGSLGVMNTFKSSTPLQLFVPVIIIGVPIFDTSLAILRRLWRKRPLFEADCDHFYEWLWKNRLLGYRNIVIITYFVCFVLGFAALFIGGM